MWEFVVPAILFGALMLVVFCFVVWWDSYEP